MRKDLDMCYGNSGMIGRCFIDGIPSDIEALKAKVREAGIERMYGHPPRPDPVFMRLIIGYPIPGYWDEHLRKEAAAGKQILLSTHAIALKGALEYLTPESKGSYWHKHIGNCAVYAFEVLPDGSWSVPEAFS